ncbi:MAG: peptide synthetase [Firmicutes bacterium HGW-Firmicutes-7]|nr:MAG: peptide synthetase [Firmicutes bacterium HGW-Firmicutes-7]
MQLYNTLSELITARKLEENKGITFITSDMDDRFISYNSLFISSLRFLYNMQEAGFKQGDEVVFQIEDNQRFVSSFWACILGGMIPVPVTTGLNDEHKMKLFKIWDILKEPKIISTKKFTASINDYAEKNNLISQINAINNSVINVEDIEKLEGYGEIAEVKNEDIAFIQFSSGSTGDPKGVILTNKNVLTNINDIANRTKTTKDDHSLSWMPLTHDMGLIAAHLVSTFVGVNQYLMPPPLFIKNPTLWLGKAHEYKATQLYSPNFGYKHFLTYYSPDAAKDWDLSNVRMILNGAEPISIELCKKFYDEMAKTNLKRNSMLTAYGLAEASVGVTYAPVGEEVITITVDRRFLNIGQQIQVIDGRDTVNKLTFVDVGCPLNHCEIRISDENNQLLKEGVIGRILIKGDNVTRGYYNNKEATNKVISKDGWLNTGDLGFMLNGRLVITGRAKDVMFIHGQNVYSHDLERVAEEHEGIEFGKVVACGTFNEKDQADEIIMFVVFKKKIENFISLYRSLKSHILLNTGIEVKHIIPVKKIPKTTSGKVRRYLLRDTYKNGDYEHIIAGIKELIRNEDVKKTVYVPQNEIEANLLKICEEVFETEKIDPNDNLNELGANSLKLVTIQEKLDKLYPNKISTSDFFSFPTIFKLVELISSKEKIELETVILPEEYFYDRYLNGGHEYKNMELELNGANLNGLKLLSKEEGIILYDVFVAMYVYLFKEITGCPEVVVHTISETGDKIIPIRVDFSKLWDLSSLFKQISIESFYYDFKDILGMKVVKNKHHIVPFISNKTIMTGHEVSSDAFDIMLEINVKAEKVEILICYNNQRLKKEMIRQFVEYYINLLTSLNEQYTNEDEDVV